MCVCVGGNEKREGLRFWNVKTREINKLARRDWVWFESALCLSPPPRRLQHPVSPARLCVFAPASSPAHIHEHALMCHPFCLSLTPASSHLPSASHSPNPLTVRAFKYSFQEEVERRNKTLNTLWKRGLGRKHRRGLSLLCMKCLADLGEGSWEKQRGVEEKKISCLCF